MKPTYAFPYNHESGRTGGNSNGMTLRDWFATFAPEPHESAITTQAEIDRQANPHGDTYKPQRRSRNEIVADLKYAYADAMMARRGQGNNGK